MVAAASHFNADRVSIGEFLMRRTEKARNGERERQLSSWAVRFARCRARPNEVSSNLRSIFRDCCFAVCECPLHPTHF